MATRSTLRLGWELALGKARRRADMAAPQTVTRPALRSNTARGVLRRSVGAIISTASRLAIRRNVLSAIIRATRFFGLGNVGQTGLPNMRRRSVGL
jgi:hypothetical protein